MKTATGVRRFLLLACVGASFVLSPCASAQPANEGASSQPPPATFADALTPSTAVPCRFPRLHYPALQRRLGIGGSVHLTYIVNTIGRIDLVVVDKSSGDDALDSAAREAFTQATCAPYVVDGVAHRVVQHVTFNFNPRPATGPAHPIPEPPAIPPTATATAAPPPQNSAPANPLLAAGPATSANATTPAAPSSLDEAIAAARLQKLGIAPDSSKAALIKRWGERMRNDPDVARFLGHGPNQPNVFLLSPSLRAGFFVEAMLRLSPEDRTTYAEVTTKAFDNAPPDCGGVKDMSQVIARYTSLGTMSDAELDAYFRVVYDIFKQSALQSPLAHVTEEQRVKGLQTVSQSIQDILKDDPEGTRDAAATFVTPADVSAEGWCRSVRTFNRALLKTPQPFRDWAIVAADTDAKAMLDAQPQSRALADSAAQDFATQVQRRVRPNIVWSGPTLDLQTAITVHCSPTGRILSATITRSSTNAAWDIAALLAVQRSDPMPVGADGRTPPQFVVVVRPAG
ncbi:MAG TPA: TonB family protein [Paraburkholderia sp.]|jgi:TonB family protein|nr:TonB family protein [Paraburkholderia sp.]